MRGNWYKEEPTEVNRIKGAHNLRYLLFIFAIIIIFLLSGHIFFNADFKNAM